MLEGGKRALHARRNTCSCHVAWGEKAPWGFLKPLQVGEQGSSKSAKKDVLDEVVKSLDRGTIVWYKSFKTNTLTQICFEKMD